MSSFERVLAINNRSNLRIVRRGKFTDGFTYICVNMLDNREVDLLGKDNARHIITTQSDWQELPYRAGWVGELSGEVLPIKITSNMSSILADLPLESAVMVQVVLNVQYNLELVGGSDYATPAQIAHLTAILAENKHIRKQVIAARRRQRRG